jgi:hypothetical protein
VAEGVIGVKRILAVAAAGLLFLSLAGPAHASNPNGRGGSMPAYYDGDLFTINFKEVKPKHNNKSINTIYMCDQCEEQGFTFVSVLDAIQGDGFNPLWEEFQVTFNPGQPFQQFTSDTDILDAEAQGIITLTDTGELYRCSVIGPK